MTNRRRTSGAWARRIRSGAATLATAACCLFCGESWLPPIGVGVRADEGMWLFSHPPIERLERTHGIRLAPAWLEHLRLSSVRFNSGGSGSFVSADGLILTNHHVAAGSLQKLGDETRNYYRDGFAAATPADEIRCPDLELNVLVSIEDVTEKVQSAVVDRMTPAEAFAARRAAMASIERESLAATGLRSDVVTLYQGARYHLYRSRKYTDVRLVFAPEHQIAFFGGDADNFEFPRYDLDVCFFRAYEEGRPARVAHHLAWARGGIAEGDLVFVSGHPGHTDRGSTVAELLGMRDRQLPFTLAALHRLEVMVRAYAGRGPEEARQAMHDLFAVANARKAREGILAALLDPAVIERRLAAETELRRSLAGLAGDPADSPWDRIERAEQEIARVAVRSRLLEGALAFNSRYFSTARTILRAAEEYPKPNGERLREFRDSNRASLEQQLFSDEPLHDAFETVKLADSLAFLATQLGPDDPLVRKVLDGKSPRDRAAEVVRGTQLGRRATPRGAAPTGAEDTRRRLYEGGRSAVDASGDTMLGLARLVDAESRGLRAVGEAAEEVKRQAHADIARLAFSREGTALYPDATFTLRLAYGTIRRYEQEGVEVPAITTYAGLFERAAAKRDTPPFDLPPRWQKARSRLERDPDFLSTPFNFASTADIIGGNSGSPVVNRDGELVGLIFDGNIQSLLLDVAYDDSRARAVAVAAGGIAAALREVYAADALLAELLPPEDAATWRSLFDGRGLGKWRPTRFGGEGEVTVDDGAILIPMGSDLSGITWGGDFPRQHYEIALEAARVDGNDFFCGLTFPVGDDPCSLIVGGWGGGVVGLSSIDGLDAASNATTQYRDFEQGRWYAVRVRVSPERIECFLDDERVVDQPLAGRTISIRDEVTASKPLGIATYATTARVRNIRWRQLPAAPAAAPGMRPREAAHE